MQREIKFRAWDTIEKKMRYEALEIKDIGLGEGSVVASQEVQTDNPLKWIQYIGLHDKNDKEIYEGDVLRLYSDRSKSGNHSDLILELAFDAPQFIGRYLREEDKNVGQILAGGLWGDTKVGTPCSLAEAIKHAKEIEVIGNIYENPELLNNKEQ